VRFYDSLCRFTAAVSLVSFNYTENMEIILRMTAYCIFVDIVGVWWMPSVLNIVGWAVGM